MCKLVPAAGLAVALSAGLASACASNPYVVGPNIQVSLAQSSVQHYETRIGANPSRTDHLIACAYAARPADVIDNVYYVSFDRGRTWAHTLTVAVGVIRRATSDSMAPHSPRASTIFRGLMATAIPSSSSIDRPMEA